MCVCIHECNKILFICTYVVTLKFYGWKFFRSKAKATKYFLPLPTHWQNCFLLIRYCHQYLMIKHQLLMSINNFLRASMSQLRSIPLSAFLSLLRLFVLSINCSWFIFMYKRYPIDIQRKLFSSLHAATCKTCVTSYMIWNNSKD